jgi:two-component system cell cycle response regulator
VFVKRILQIDDEPAISAALKVRLRAAGFEVFTASDGPSGLLAAASNTPEAILLDIRMPGMDGFEVCRRLKSDPAMCDIPVVFLSANTKEEARVMADEVGGAAFISKPYEAAEVVEVLLAVTG